MCHSLYIDHKPIGQMSREAGWMGLFARWICLFLRTVVLPPPTSPTLGEALLLYLVYVNQKPYHSENSQSVASPKCGFHLEEVSRKAGRWGWEGVPRHLRRTAFVAHLPWRAQCQGCRCSGTDGGDFGGNARRTDEVGTNRALTHLA